MELLHHRRQRRRALARAKELGANVHADAFDVMDVGRMGVVQDPQGAYFLVWEPKAHIGASLVNAPGALSWNELATPDLDGLGGFYSRLFGWSTEAMEGMDMPYLMIKTAAGTINGGIRPQMPRGAAVSGWSISVPRTSTRRPRRSTNWAARCSPARCPRLRDDRDRA